ncbi:MAG: hypothetical protein DRP66_09420 [Planctomycetota bacterium]|nr:MAG: hypothetical protein DRP66_09420 [Planctomycetota bacterium]
MQYIACFGFCRVKLRFLILFIRILDYDNTVGFWGLKEVWVAFLPVGVILFVLVLAVYLVVFA